MENNLIIREAFNKVKEKIEELEKRIGVLEESQSQSVPFSPNQSQNKIEDIIIKKFKRGRKPAIIEKIKQLSSSGISVIDIKEDLVDRQKLIPKSTFYRYVDKIQNGTEIIDLNKIPNETKK